MFKKGSKVVPFYFKKNISIRFTYKQKGMINISGFHVDPYYKGKLIFSVYNAGPSDILLKKGERVFMIFFQRLPCKIPSEERESKRTFKPFLNIPLEMMATIRGQSVTLASNAEKINRLEFYFKVLAGVTMTIFTVLVGAIIAKVFG